MRDRGRSLNEVGDRQAVALRKSVPLPVPATGLN
jgi:hypothetical protein